MDNTEKLQEEYYDSNLATVDVAFFYPSNKEAELIVVMDHFRDVIRKHKLKFRLDPIFERPYRYDGNIDYPFFVQSCKKNTFFGNVGIALVLGPPFQSEADADHFANTLLSVMGDEHIYIQLIPWDELHKEKWYLKLALDITLLKDKL
jgi:hypothetical protein